MPEVALLDEVEAGQLLGTIRDAMSAIRAEIRADQAGVIIMLRGLPRVQAGDGIAHITQHVHQPNPEILIRDVMSELSQPVIAIGGILHETHTFMEQPTTLADFEAGSLYRGDQLLAEMGGTRSGIGGMIDRATDLGWQLLPTLYATAMPAGTVTEEAYRRLLAELLDRLRGALRLDGVLLALHGAMVAEGELDVEAHIVSQVRAIVGAATPIVVLLDMHGNISPRLVELADVLLAYDTNPHIDGYARGSEAVEIMAKLLRREIRPTAAYARPALLLPPQATGTNDMPLAPVHDRAAEMEAEDGVICIAVMAGFAYADTPYTGASIIVTADDQPELAGAYARELSDMLHMQRKTALPRFLAPAVAVAQALQHADGPIIWWILRIISAAAHRAMVLMPWWRCWILRYWKAQSYWRMRKRSPVAGRRERARRSGWMSAARSIAGTGRQ